MFQYCDDWNKIRSTMLCFKVCCRYNVTKHICCLGYFDADLFQNREGQNGEGHHHAFPESLATTQLLVDSKRITVGMTTKEDLAAF